MALGLCDNASESNSLNNHSLDLSGDFDNTNNENFLEDSMDLDANLVNFMTNSKSSDKVIPQIDHNSNVNESFYSVINEESIEENKVENYRVDEHKVEVNFAAESKILPIDSPSPIPSPIANGNNEVNENLQTNPIKHFESLPILSNSSPKKDLSLRESNINSSNTNVSEYALLNIQLQEEKKQLQLELAEELSFRTLISSEYKEREEKLIHQHFIASSEYKEREDILMQQYRQ